METQPRRGGLKSGTILMLALLIVIAGLLTAARLRLKAHEKTARSIAVLPFLSGTNSPEVDHLCEMLTQQVIRNLQSAKKLTVTPEDSVARYRGNVLSPWKAGNELNVDVVIVGRVQRNHDTLIIQTDLMNAADESQLWGQQYERPRTDPNALALEIAKDISDHVLTTLAR